jgi:hypothetical protein
MSDLSDREFAAQLRAWADDIAEQVPAWHGIDSLPARTERPIASLSRRIGRRAILAALAITAVVGGALAVRQLDDSTPSVGVTATAPGTETGRAADGRCLPEPMAISPGAAAPGLTVTVSSRGGCTDGSISGAHYRISLGFAGRQPPVLDAGAVDPGPDGAFSTVVQVPANATPGDAYVSVTGSPFDSCSDSGSCAGYSVSFAIQPFPASDRTSQDVLGAGSWSGARTSKDGSQVVIVLVGGPEYEVSNPCSVAYQADVTETDADVRVRILGTSPPPPDASNFGCDSVGHFRTVIVSLQDPLGSRTLTEEQFSRSQPVFDGSTLADVGSLPAGWRSLTEGPGYPDPQSARYWSRSWGPTPAVPQGGRCTSSESPIVLTQGPADLIDRYPSNGEQPVRVDDVHGQQATYLFNPTLQIGRLQWAERGQAFVVATMPGCLGDTPASEEELLTFARSLSVP